MEIDRESLLVTFVAESEENLAVIEAALLAMEAAPDDAELVATLFRAAHTLKGNSEALELPALATAAHAVEDVLAGLRARRIKAHPGLVTLMLDARDVMARMLEAAAHHRPLTTDDSLLVRLVAAARGGATDSGQPSVPPDVTHEGSSGVVGPCSGPRRTLRVDLRTLDRMVTLLEELAVAHGRLHVATDLAGGTRGVDAMVEAERHFHALREEVMRLRLVEVEGHLRALARVVRDMAAATGKRARLLVEAHGVEVDTTVLDALRDPMTHMIRNAVDHGLETPEVRHEAGKDVVGTIAIRAHREAGRLVVEVNDDGAGFSRARILARAREMGTVRGDGSDLRDEQVFRLALAHGFTTTDKVTDLSGRGVGMDVVARAVTALRGTIDITSREGQGSTVVIRVPLMLSIIEGFTVDVAQEAYVVPLDSVRECVELPASARSEAAHGIISLRGQALPFVRLRSLFGLPGAPPGRENVVVVEHEGECAGLAVDMLRGRSQAVMKPLSEVLRPGATVTGTTLLGDGRVALILDVPAILREVAGRHVQQPRLGVQS